MASMRARTAQWLLSLSLLSLLSLLFLFGGWASAAHAQSHAFEALVPQSADDRIEEVSAAVQGPEGTVWIADPDAGRLYSYDSDGAPQGETIRTLTLRSGEVTLDEPYDLHITSDGTLYVLDRGVPAVYVVRDDPQQSYAMGQEGGDLGYFDTVRSLAVDPGGYVYVLDEDQEALSVFAPDGRFRTWIRGAAADFKDVVAVGTNGNGEIYVLEERGPDVHILDRTGTPLVSHEDLSSMQSVSIEAAADLAVLQNGDFLIANRDDSRVTHFKRDGTVVGTFGGEGRSGRGVFGEAGRLSVGGPAQDHVAVLDIDRKQVQIFRAPMEATESSYQAPQLQLRAASAASLPAFRDAAYAPDGTVYYIPYDEDDKVIAQAPGADTPLFTLQVEEARAVALHNESLVVLDSDERQVLVYDRIQGARIRTFGSNIPTELDEPMDATVLSDGSIVVADEKTGALHRWNAQGIYESSLSPSPRRQSAPRMVAADSRDRLYVWDTDKEALLRLSLDAEESDAEAEVLELRGESLEEKGSEALGLLVDPLDQVHLFNLSTHQYSIFAWFDAPVPLLRHGRRGDALGFDDVEAIAFDPVHFVAHVQEDGGDAVASFGIAVRPDPPEGPLAFGAVGNALVVSFPSPETSVATGYALLRHTDGATYDTVAVADSSRLLLPPGSAEGLQTYSVASLSPTGGSDPALSFEDAFGHGNRLQEAGQYEAAYDAYEQVLKEEGVTESLRAAIGKRLAQLGQAAITQGDTPAARKYLQAAGRIAAENEAVARVLAGSYASQLRYLARRGEYRTLLVTASDLLQDTDSTSVLRTRMVQVVDSVATELQGFSDLEGQERAVSYYRQLLDWGAAPEATSYALAETRSRIYSIKVRENAASYERGVALNEALQAAQEAVERQSSSSSYYHDARLVQMRLLLAQEEYSTVLQKSTQALTAQEVPMSDVTQREYRMVQARAYEAQGNHAEAVRIYRRLANAFPDDTALKLRLAEAMVETGAYDEAKLIYQRLLSERGETPRLLTKVGELELARENFSEASLQLEKAIEQDPNFTEAYGPLARAYDGASNYRKALDSYQRAIQAVQRRLSNSQDVQQSKALKASLVDYRIRLGYIQLRLADFEASVETYEQVSETAPSNIDAWYGLGLAALEAGRVYQSVTALEQALKLNPNDPQVQEKLAQARRLKEQLQANRPPVEILNARVDPLYPSLYRNYSDPSELPIGEVVLANNTDLPMQNLRLTVFVEPLMDAPTQQSVRSLPPASNRSVAMAAIFSDAILERTEKATFQAQIRLIYQQQGREQATETTTSFTVYGRNAIKWKDRRRLAAFVSPQDEEIINYVKAADRTFAGLPPYGMSTNLQKAAQLYTVLMKENLTYSVDPQTDFSVVSQDPTQLDFLQFPEETLQRKAGDCDDLVALYASLLQNAGIKAAYIDLPGHVMVAFDSGLSPSDLGKAGLSRDDVVVERGTAWVPIEATFLDGKSFLEARNEGLDRMRRERREGTIPEIVPLPTAQEIYEPASFALPAGTSLSLPADPSALRSTYQEQASTLYAQMTEVRRQELEQRHERHPENIVVANELAILYAQGGMLDQAASLYQETLEQSPASALLHNNLGNVLYRLEQHAEALRHYQESLSLDDSDPLVYVNAARAHLALGQDAEARAAFEKAAARRPSVRNDYPDLRARL